MKKLTTLLLPLLALSLFIAGCGKSSGGPPTVPVSGTLKIGGNPAANVQVTFIPVDAEVKGCSGNTDENGKFSMFTGQLGTPGAMKGKYKVVARSLVADEGAYKDDRTDDVDTLTDGGTAQKVESDPLVPDKYRSVQTTDKEVEITKKESNLVIEFDGK